MDGLRPISRLALFSLLLSTVALSGGCAASKGETSRLQDDDLLVASNKMKDSLGSSDFLRDRTPASPRVVVVTDKVENLTDSIIPVGQQWATVLRVQNGLPMQQLSKQKNVKFVVPPERAAMAKGTGVEVADISQGLRPTHVLTASFTSSSRTAQDKSGVINRKQDYYFLEFKLSDIQGGEIVWSNAFEFKREATGNLID
jgi:hypothetical protein